MTGIIISTDEKYRIKSAISDIKKIIREEKCVSNGDFYEFSGKDLRMIVTKLKIIEFLIGA